MLLREQPCKWDDSLTDYQLKSRMMGDYHVRFCERLGVKFPLPTRLGQDAPPITTSKMKALILILLLSLGQLGCSLKTEKPNERGAFQIVAIL
jgi:hypothetical protein